MIPERLATTIKPVPRTIPARDAPLNGKNQVEKMAPNTRETVRASAMFECLIFLLSINRFG